MNANQTHVRMEAPVKTAMDRTPASVALDMLENSVKKVINAIVQAIYLM